jgi:hypothetical protein
VGKQPHRLKLSRRCILLLARPVDVLQPFRSG